MNIRNKIVSIALTASTMVWASGALVYLPVANAQSAADLQNQIAALLTQIQQLQSQLGRTGGTTPAAPSTSYSFTRDLTVGSKGADVKALQQFLNSKGFVVAQRGPGSPGNESTYFGPATKAALVKWQRSVRISPASGYFGPKTRAYISSLAIVTPPIPPIPPPVTTSTPPTSTSTPPVPPAASSSLAVALSSDNPAPGSLITVSSGNGAARTRVLGFTLSAGRGSAVTVSQINFRKVGVLADSAINGAYIVEGGRVIAQYNSASGGVITFSGLNLSVAAGQTRTLGLAIDVAGGLSAGNSVAFSINSAADVNSVDASGNAIIETGLPIQGNTFTVTSVTNPSLASLTISSTSVATQVTAGTTNNIVAAWNLSISNSKTFLQSINLRVIGSANKTDIRNVKLYINGTQVGSALASVDAGGNAYFDLTTSPGTLNTGSNNVQVFADVMGSPSFNFQFQILNSYDVLAVDSQYNVPITASANAGTQITIQQGQINVSTASNTPTGNIAVGQSGVTLARYNIYAAGEAVRVRFIGFSLAFTGTNAPTSTTALAAQIRNVALTDDAGGQIGTTISTPPSSNGNAASGGCDVAGTALSTTNTTYTDCLGTGASNINYIVPANTTRVLSLKADVQTTANFATVTASLLGETNNLQGLTSAQTASSAGASGSALTLSSTLLTTAQNTAFGTPNVTKNSSGVKIGSYALTASSASGVTINSITITAGTSANTNYQNLKVMVGGTQFGNPIGVVASNGQYSFSGTPFTVSVGGTTYVDVYADIMSNAATMTTATTLSGCTGTAVASYTSVTCSSVAGQGITITGQASVTVNTDASQAPAANIVMGSTGNSLATFRFAETSNAESVKITNLNVFDQVASTSTKPSFGNITLWQVTPTSTILVGTAGSAATSIATSTPGSGYIYTFNFATPVVVPQINSISLTLKGDVSSYGSGGATDNATHTFKIATSTDSTNNTTALAVVTVGASSNASSSVTLSSPAGNAMRILRTVLTASVTPNGATSGRSKNSLDDLAFLTFNANASGAAVLNSVTVTFSGSAPSSSSFLGGVDLLDANQNSVMATTGVTSSTSAACNGSNTCTKTWNLGAGTSGWQISGGGSYTFKLRINSFNTQTAAAQTSVTLGVTVQNATDVGYTDGLDGTASTQINLPATAVPLQVTTVTYAIGT